MNLKYQFYRAYYQDFDPCWFEDKKKQEALEEHNEKGFKKINERRLYNYQPKGTLEKWHFKKSDFGDNLKQFPLKTTYPGLVIGTGYTHETGNIGEIKIGFHFDHTSGLPILPGHSVKGAIRAYFPRAGEKLSSKENKAIKRAKAAYILSLLDNQPKGDEQVQYDWVKKLELQIFDGGDLTQSDHSPKDVFLDAQISEANSKGKILGPDVITPHGDKIWKNPTPLPFLKVLPQVGWQFSFLLHKTTIDGIEISAEQKKNLFKAILLDQGVGAKTNVGYGHFSDPNATAQNINKDSDSKAPPKGDPLPPSNAPVRAKYFRGNLKHKAAMQMEGEVLESGKTTLVKIFMKEGNCPEHIINRNLSALNLKKGDILILDVKLKKKDLSIEYVNYKSKKK